MAQDKENLKKKILYRLKYRGIKELDLLFSKFADKYYETINDNDLNELVILLEIPDLELLDFILGKRIIPSNLKTKTFIRLKSLNK
tara:strand:+ start:173 stop:430 length:258 start_codon:yes stop_codon:yes gene_type:complete